MQKKHQDTSRQKNQEWESIRNIIPQIEKHLQLKSIFHEEKFESECPDFIFYNNIYSIGIEVTECHPSVQKNKKKNAPAIKSLKDRICSMFIKNNFLASITEDVKLNILIDCGCNFSISTKPEDVCCAIEKHLIAWHLGEKCSDVRLIRRIRVIETKGKNIVQFNSIARRDPIEFQNLVQSISEKEKKLTSYMMNTTCNEYWLCIYLPFEENRQSNMIECRIEDEEKYRDIIQKSMYDRIILTSVLRNDIFWLKGNINLC